MVISKIGAFLAVPAAIAAIVGGVLAFNGSYVTKDSFDSKIQAVEIQLAGVLKDFREEVKDDRQQSKKDNFRTQIQQLQHQEEYYADRLNQLEENPTKQNEYQREFYRRQLDRIREQHNKIQEALINIQTNR